jgi:hypothetical protein
MAEENKIILDADVKPLKKQLREATQELQVARQKYGEFSNEATNAAQKVAGIRDEIEAANEAAQLFDPGKRFQALTTAASTAAGGIAAVQGAMALFGNQSEEVEKALLKVQGAMALSQGLSQLKDIGKVGEQLKISFQGLTAGANGFKKALISTGIGALVVAVGLLVAYWEDIMSLIDGVSSEQKKLNAETQKNLDASRAQLDTIENQHNQLKLQGKTEQEILDIKIARTKETIKDAQALVASAQITKQFQLEAAKRNQDIAKGIILFLMAPVEIFYSAVDALTLGLQKIGVLKEATSFMENYDEIAGQMASDQAAFLGFDAKKVEEEGNKTVMEAENTLNSLLEKQAGYELSKIDLQKQGGEKASAEREKQSQKEMEAEAILQDARNKMLSEQLQQEEAIKKTYDEKQKKLDEAGIKDDGSLAEARNKELQAVRDKFQKEEADKEAEFQKQLNDIRTQTRLEGIKDENEKAREQILLEYQKQRDEVLNNEKLTSEQKTALQLELAQQEKQALDALQLTIDQANAERALLELDMQMKEAEASFQIQKDLIDQKEALSLEQFQKGLINEQQYNEALKGYSEARMEIDKKENEAKMANAAMAAGLLGTVSDLVGRNTAAGKATAIAATTIDTYLGAQKAYTSQLIPGDPSSPIRAAIAAAIAVAGGIKNVREIVKTKVPGGGAASAPSISAAAPGGVPQVPTIGNSPITALGAAMQPNQPLRAYVVESEVTGTQKRVADIERRAGF